MPGMFDLTGVSKFFGDVAALAVIDLTVAVGRTTVLIGLSGCGKSTLLKLMIGLHAPDTGTVSFAGDPLTRDNAQSRHRRMGYVIQEGGLFSHLTARANVALMARWLGWDEARVNERITELARLTRFPADGLEPTRRSFPAAALALLVQGVFEIAERMVVAKGLRLNPAE